MQDDLNNNENKNKSEGKKSIIPMWVIVLGILLIIVIPLLINILFKLDLGWDWLKAEWSAGEILTYYGTFLGPTILSIVALKQNEKFEEANDESQKKMERMNQRANKISEKMLSIEETNYELKVRPFVNVAGYEMGYWGYKDLNDKDDRIWIEIDKDCVGVCGKYPGLSLKLVNSSESILIMSYHGAEFDNDEVEWKNITINPQFCRLVLKPGEAKLITFLAKPKTFDEMMGKQGKLSFMLENRFAQPYIESFDMVFSHIRYMEEDNKWNLLFFFKNYEISRIQFDESGNITEIKENIYGQNGNADPRPDSK